jgi:hypothetical protein
MEPWAIGFQFSGVATVMRSKPVPTCQTIVD